MFKHTKITLILIFFSFGIFAQRNGPINWVSLQKADSLYQIQPKPFFIDVYTDWCGWCKRMDATTFSNQEIANYLNQNFYAVKLDAETKNSILFKGSVFKNTQQEKVKVLLDSLNLELKIISSKLSYNDSIKKAQTALFKRPLNINQLLFNLTNKLSESAHNKEQFDILKKDIFLKHKKQKAIVSGADSMVLSKEELKGFKKSLKTIKKSDTSSVKNLLTVFDIQVKESKDGIETLLNPKKDKELKNAFQQKEAQLKSFARRARKTTHDVAIELCQGQMSYPTFILLFGDSLSANMPLKGFKKVDELYAYLAFVNEGIYKSTRDVANFVSTFKKVYNPSFKPSNDNIKWLSFDEAVKRSKKNKKQIFIHIAHPNSIASNLIDKNNLINPTTVKKINSNFNPVKFLINDTVSYNHLGALYKNVNGINQLAFYLTKNQLSFPNFSFLDSQGNVITNVPQYFAETQINPVLDYFTEEAYKKSTYGDWLKNRPQSKK